MPKEYKTTFNYFLSHRVIPNMVFSDPDLFFGTIITTPQNMQLFMQNAMRVAANMIRENPDIQPASPVSAFEMYLFGLEEDRGLVVVKIPNCQNDCDSFAVAFPIKREHARYFTYELCANPLNDENFFIVGEWKLNGKDFGHQNYGRVDPQNDGFPRKVADIVYGEK